MPAPRATNGIAGAWHARTTACTCSVVSGRHDERGHDPVPGEPVALVGPQLLRLGRSRRPAGSAASIGLASAIACQSTAAASIRLRRSQRAWRLAASGEARAHPHAGGARLRRRPAARASAAAARSCSQRRDERQQRLRRRRAAGLPRGDARRPRGPTWRVAEAPPDLQDRRVEITGPDRPQDGDQRAQLGRAASSWPTSRTRTRRRGRTCVEGQSNLIDAVERTISLDTGEKSYRLNDEIATLLVRPRGWHLPEQHVLGRRRAGVRPACSTSASTCSTRRERAARRAAAGRTSTSRSSRATSRRGSGTTSFLHAQDALGIPRGTIRATVLIETILAAFEMEEILYELREHSAGLNAGRWDYIFSVIKKFRAPRRLRAARPAARDDDRAVHARVHRAAREDVPPRAARTRSAAWPRSSPTAAIPR